MALFPTSPHVMKFHIASQEDRKADKSQVAPIHNRIAAMLRREHENTWVNPDFTEASKLKPLLAPYPADETECFPVSRVAGPHQYPEPLKPVHQDALL